MATMVTPHSGIFSNCKQADFISILKHPESLMCTTFITGLSFGLVWLVWLVNPKVGLNATSMHG